MQFILRMFAYVNYLPITFNTVHMKKITSFLLLFAVVFAVSAQDQRKWQGSQELKTWDYATPNWLNPASPLPIPTTFSEGAIATFDDSILRESDTIKVSGDIKAASVTVNATKTYVIHRTADTDSISGEGAFVKDGSGVLVMDVKNAMQGGTILKAGVMKMEKQTSPNVWGSKIVFDGGTANFATSSSSSYPLIEVPIEIPAGKTAKIELSRYSYFKSKITGDGNLDLYVGGERTYFGKKNDAPDLSEFNGSITVYPYVMDGVSPGFYALMLNTNKTFLDSLEGFNIDSTLYNKKLHLMPGAHLIAESGSRAYAIGELTTEDSTSVIASYYKNSTTPVIRYFVGGLNTDVEVKGRISGYPGTTKGYLKTQIVKVGTGTYRFTHHNNFMVSGMIVREGTALIDDEVWKGHFRGGVGGFVTVEPRGTLGGKGRIQGNVDLAGTLKPGSNGVGTLLIRDSISFSPDSVGGTRSFNLTFQPGSVAEFEVKSATEYDQVVSSGTVRFNNDSNSVVAKPLIRIKMVDGYVIKDGDQFEIITAKDKHIDSQSYDIEYPAIAGVTWSSEEVVTEDPASMKLIIKAAGSATGLNQVQLQNVSVYPNPMTDVANFRSADAMITNVEIINLQGQVVRSQSANTNELVVSVSDLQTGLYYARVTTSKGTEVHKLMLK